MTVSPREQAATPAEVGDLDTGLGEFGIEDAVVPRLKIMHKQGVFEDSLSKEQYPSIDAIILGLVKQRILWHFRLDDGDNPMCRSVNHEEGYPNLDMDNTPKDKRFPWDKSGFRAEDFPPMPDGTVKLPCKGCKLKEWESHPDGKKPYCSEQFTLPLLYRPTDADDDENFIPAILSFSKTSLAPLRSYLSSFQRQKVGAYTAVTRIKLDLIARGGNEYSVPAFTRGDKTDPDDWRGFSYSFQGMKEFLHTAPNRRGADDSEEGTATEPAPADNAARPPEDAPKPAATTEPEPAEEKQPVAKEEPKAEAASAPADDDDLPF